MRTKEIFNGSRSSLGVIVKNLGFKWAKDESRRGLMQTPRIAHMRVEFLSKYMSYKKDGVYTSFIFLDETWIFQNGTITKSWHDKDLRSLRKIKPDGKRQV